MSFSPLWGVGGAYLNDIELPPVQTFRVSTLILTRIGVKYPNSGRDKALSETLKVFSAQGGNLG